MVCVQVLTSHSCSEEGLEDAANILLQLSRGDAPTRDTVLRLLLSGARHLGYTLCKQIGQFYVTTLFMKQYFRRFLYGCSLRQVKVLNSEYVLFVDGQAYDDLLCK